MCALHPALVCRGCPRFQSRLRTEGATSLFASSLWTGVVTTVFHSLELADPPSPPTDLRRPRSEGEGSARMDRFRGALQVGGALMTAFLPSVCLACRSTAHGAPGQQCGLGSTAACLIMERPLSARSLLLLTPSSHTRTCTCSPTARTSHALATGTGAIVRFASSIGHGLVPRRAVAR